MGRIPSSPVALIAKCHRSPPAIPCDNSPSHSRTDVGAKRGFRDRNRVRRHQVSGLGLRQPNCGRPFQVFTNRVSGPIRRILGCDRSLWPGIRPARHISGAISPYHRKKPLTGPSELPPEGFHAGIRRFTAGI
jgi:hypothetical protein